MRSQVQILNGPPLLQLLRSRGGPKTNGQTGLIDAASGDVAQLAEHRLCKAGVTGSNPVISKDGFSALSEMGDAEKMSGWYGRPRKR